MPYIYKNRRSDAFYLYPKITKTGKTTYSATQKKKAGALDELPEGYEVYENYNAQVFLRRIDQQVITDFEVQQVRQVVKETTKLKHIWVERKKDAIIVSTCSRETDPDSFVYSGAPPEDDFLLGFLGDIKRQAMGDHFSRHARLRPMLRFTLMDPEDRLYCVERYCFRGSIDDWIDIGSARFRLLTELAKEYCPHLDKESFYDLI